MRCDRVLWQATSVALRYPQLDQLELVREVLPDFVDQAVALGQSGLESHYTQTFDFTQRHCLYLTWYSDGDTRRRGTSLVQLKRSYASAGLLFSDSELPDYLPAVLEYAALTGDSAPLVAHRCGIVALGAALDRADSLYALPVAALLRTLPMQAIEPVLTPPTEMVGIS